MGNKPTFGDVLTEADQRNVTAYLVAITQQLQRSSKEKRARDDKIEASGRAVRTLDQEAQPEGDAGPPPEPPFDMAEAKEMYERVCSDCHDLSDVDDAPPTSAEEANELLVRMVEENDLEATAEELATLERYLIEVFVNKKKN
jgi:mono/diheme cytochrome c family protein